MVDLIHSISQCQTDATPWVYQQSATRTEWKRPPPPTKKSWPKHKLATFLSIRLGVQVYICVTFATNVHMATKVSHICVFCTKDFVHFEIRTTFSYANKHWRRVEETLCTFCTSKVIIDKYWNKFVSMCQYEHYPFEQPLHEIYKTEYCLSPIPSLAIHCTNVNSIYGLSPNIDWKKIWDENADYWLSSIKTAFIFNWL